MNLPTWPEFEDMLSGKNTFDTEEQYLECMEEYITDDDCTSFLDMLKVAHTRDRQLVPKIIFLLF
jgi:hypothetical protein